MTVGQERCTGAERVATLNAAVDWTTTEPLV